MDTHATYKNLVQAGLTDQQSEAIVNGLRGSRDTLVTNKKLEAALERRTRIILLAVTGIVSALNAILFVLLQLG